MLKELLVLAAVTGATPIVNHTGHYECQNLLTVSQNEVILVETNKGIFAGLRPDEVITNIREGNVFAPKPTNERYDLWVSEGPSEYLRGFALRMYDLIPNVFFVFNTETKELVSVCTMTDEPVMLNMEGE